MVERTAGAVVQAAERLSVADLTVAVGQETTIARNRRRPHGLVDPTVTVLRAGRGALPAAYFLHYACHPTVLGPDNLLISRDYVGFAVDALARATGGWTMFANGACADINVGHSADRSALGLPSPGRTFERAEALGQRLAAEAGRALADARPAVVGDEQRRTLAANRRAVLVPLRPAPRPEDARRAVASWRERVRALEQAGAELETQHAARLELMYADLALQWVESRSDAQTEAAEVLALAIGDVALVALPGEFFAESGLRLRAQSPFPCTIPVGYAGGGIGYVPPAAAFEEGGYETRLTPWSRVAPDAEARILSAAIDILHALRRQQREGPG
ncbi:MAG: hypothetical protein QN120_04125 [Armatimonadota bacterium]|nr:hypothetical protein [Armatimonadota bacterium]